MPSDFISLLSSDLDLNSPKSLYSKESVYDLLPKELQLQPSSTQADPPTMSQKSGGEAGPPPSAALASDATSSTSSPSASSSVAMGVPCSGISTGSSTLPSDQLKVPQHLHSTGGDGAGAEMQGMEGAVSAPNRGNSGANTAAGDVGSGVLSGLGVQQPQNTPSKRRPVLSISPPPEDLFDDSQMSCQDEPTVSAPTGPDSEHSSSMWADDSVSNFSLISSISYNDNTEVPRKSRKRTPRQRPGPKPAPPEDSMDVFDADSAKAPHFVLSQLGPDKTSPMASSLESGTAVKGGSLSTQFPQRSDGKELKILVQPETQHRARYLTEGSRGSVKDRTQQGFPTVKLEGVSESVVLQVFVANDAGRVKPHGFYQACRVTGRNTTACKEVDIEGTTVIEIPLEPSNDMTLAVDCVGILKLRNADVEARIGVAGSKKKSTRARLAFRVGIPQSDGSVLTLQVPSSPILCTQPAGVPEILKKSLHSCSVRGGEEVFIIGKNFLKGTKVIFQENVADDNSWQAEAKIDMDLFHQNHLIVTVPSFHNQSITSPVSVGIFVMTNAGRSHDAQPFTYTPDSADNSNVRTVKTEGPSLVKTCIFDGQIKSMSSDQTDCSSQPSKRQEDTPMEVSSNPPAADVFKPSPDPLVSVQQTLELSSSPHPSGESFQSPMPLQPEDVELPQAPPVFPSLESLGTIQKQDIAPAASFPVSGDPTIPPVTPEVPQQFLRDPQESLPPEGSNSSGGVVVVAMPQISTPSQPQPQQSQVPLFPQEGVAQLERAVRELQAGSNTTLQQVLEAAVAQQQLNSVLYSPTPSAESLQQHVQENMNSLRLGTTDNSLSTQQQIQIQQQQQMQQQQQQQQQIQQQFQQHQQLQQQQQQILDNLQQQQQQHLQQQQQQVIGNMQIQQQLILQPQDQQQLQQQQQQIMENIQQQQLQQNQQQQVLNNIQLQDQQQNQMLSNLQQHQLQQQQQQQQQNQALSNLQQQQQQQLQEQQVLENLQQQLQAELLQPQIRPTPQVQQPVSLLQQAGELLTIQTSFPTQPPSHTSPPQQLFQSPRPLAETQGSQQQVQAALLQNTLTVLTSGSLNSEQQSTGSTLYLSPNPQPQQQQQLAFISSMETSTSQPQSVSMFQNQPQAQLSQMQQQSTPMEQQQSPQQNQEQPPQLPMGQQGSLFQSIPNHSQPNPVPQSQLSQQQQAGLLLCTTDLNPQAIPPTILFSTQTQGPPPIGSISVGIPQPDPAEPMSFQDQSSSGSNSTSTENQQQSLFQEQQPMQVGPSSSRVPSNQPVELFLPQTSLSSLQSTIGSQELNTQAPAPGTTIFVVQGGVGVVASPGQQPPEQLFQTTVGGNVAPQGQANLFVFGIQNDSPQLLNSSGSTLPAQSQAQNSSHMQPLLDQPMAQAASSMPAAMHSNLQNTLQAQMQSSLENAMQTSLQNTMQTNTQTALQSSLQATIETSLPTPMQTNLQTQIQSSLQNTLQSSISASSNMDKIEDLLESLQKQ
ncbi:nuclear factor of activated T-cells 5a isoform X1 [Thunnus albacares]|uniref:nuclear factor of activated T-cells 5a isoform X1 n=2 Tax=Thunnus albacares TaxID=8236 RepID=UPI001CF6076B|nr:nuclear factor of activated T-cells 5a isoform X1 [Thunnus albacares]